MHRRPGSHGGHVRNHYDGRLKPVRAPQLTRTSGSAAVVAAACRTSNVYCVHELSSRTEIRMGKHTRAKMHYINICGPSVQRHRKDQSNCAPLSCLDSVLSNLSRNRRRARENAYRREDTERQATQRNCEFVNASVCLAFHIRAGYLEKTCCGSQNGW